MRARAAFRLGLSCAGSRTSAISLGVLLAGLIMVGCGSGGIGGDTSPAPEADASDPVKGELTISQWPLYVDPGKNGSVAE